MKHLHILILLILPFFIQAQITLDASDLPVAGDVLTTVDCDVPMGFSEGLAGANQTYDLTGMIPVDTTIINFLSPNGTPGDNEFPNATLSGEVEGNYSYYQQTSTELFLLGVYVDTSSNGTGQYLVSHFNPTDKIFEIPSTYNTSFTDMNGTSITQANGTSGDSIRVTSDVQKDVLFDGYGTVITPNGTFNGLRERTINTSTNLIEFYTFGIWTTINTTTNIDTSYNWYSNNNIGLAGVSILNGEVVNASYSIQDPVILAPVADFSTDDQGGGTIAFTDNSSNSPLSWSWDFGDGSNSTLQNPQHTYASPGIYTVCLTASNNVGADVICMSVSISLAPISAFTFTGETTGTVDFTDASTNNPTTWLWDFGDGNTSTVQSPQHSYSTFGTYTVCLTVTNSVGSDMICMDVTITLTPVAAFTFDIQNPGVVDFTDASTNNPTSWLWDLGDGNTSNEQNPQHTYATSGNYTVCLTVTNLAGSNTICETVEVIITSTEDLEKLVRVKLFPNPVSDILNISLENHKREILDFQLTDAFGRIVKRLSVETIGSYNVNIKNLATGIYYYTFKDAEGAIRKEGSLMKN